LFSADLNVDQLHLDDVELRLAEATEPQQEESAGELALPDANQR